MCNVYVSASLVLCLAQHSKDGSLTKTLNEPRDKPTVLYHQDNSKATQLHSSFIAQCLVHSTYTVCLTIVILIPFVSMHCARGPDTLALSQTH